MLQKVIVYLKHLEKKEISGTEYPQKSCSEFGKLVHYKSLIWDTAALPILFSKIVPRNKPEHQAAHHPRC